MIVSSLHFAARRALTTIRLTITNTNSTNEGDPVRVASVKKLNLDENGDGTDVPAEAVDLAPGESTEVTLYKGREILILEKP